jgi:DNA replicative helicase MCM subunit Mcm2 (Cdc46/Mcm family)
LWDFVQTGEEPCPIDPWIVVPDKSKYVDQQTLKMQENPEVIILILVNWMVVLS